MLPKEEKGNMNSPCEACKGKGWLIVALDGNEANLEVQRCDACGRMTREQARYLPAATFALREAIGSENPHPQHKPVESGCEPSGT